MDEDNRLQFRVTAEMKAAVESAAAAEMLTVSVWLKQAVASVLRQQALRKVMDGE